MVSKRDLEHRIEALEQRASSQMDDILDISEKVRRLEEATGCEVRWVPSHWEIRKKESGE